MNSNPPVTEAAISRKALFTRNKTYNIIFNKYADDHEGIPTIRSIVPCHAGARGALQ